MRTLRRWCICQISVVSAGLAGGPIDLPNVNTDFSPAEHLSKTQLIEAFRPLRTESAALSTDGSHVAYSWRHDEDLSVVVVAVDAPTEIVLKARVSNDALATPPRYRSSMPQDRAAARVLALEWMPGGRVVGVTNRYHRERSMFAFDLDGNDAHRVIAPRNVDPRNFIVGVSGTGSLLVRSGASARARHFAVDVRRGRFTPVSAARWDREARAASRRKREQTARWQEVAGEVSEIMPQMTWDLVGSDEPKRQFLVRGQGRADAGAFYLFAPEERRLTQIIRCSGVLGEDRCHATVEFDFVGKHDEKASGALTLPRKPRARPAPIIMMFPSGASQHTPRRFDPQMQAFADLGYAVLQVDGRLNGSSPRDGRVDVDAERARIEWIWEALEAVERGGHAIARDRVVVYGERAGAYSALRAAQYFPNRVQAAVAIEPDTDWSTWKGSREQALPPITAPVLVMSYPAPPPKASVAGPSGSLPVVGDSRQYKAAREVYAATLKAGAPAVFHDLPWEHRRGSPEAMAEVFLRIERFLSKIAFGYEVEIGEATIEDG